MAAQLKTSDAGFETKDRGRDRGRDRDRDDRDRGRDRDDDDSGSRKFGGNFSRKKVCRFCADTEYTLDYKDARMMQSFVSEHGKIVPRRISGTCAKHQRKLTTAIKRARNIAFVGYVSSGAPGYSERRS